MWKDSEGEAVEVKDRGAKEVGAILHRSFLTEQYRCSA